MGLSCDRCGDSISSFDKVYCEDCASEKNLGFSEDNAFSKLLERLEQMNKASKSLSIAHLNTLNEFATEFIKEL
jgi:hypothetical protein